MEESVALDTSKQKDFVKSVRGIKKILKKKDKRNKESEVSIQDDKVTSAEKVKKRRKRGLVYLSHIPHGFYENQMTEYFKQFGVVTNARVIRSKRTGNSKGFAFVEFKEPSVAEVVAETMNNYLMGKRLIKALYIPPHKQRVHAMRKKWDSLNNPGREQRLKFKKINNADKTEGEELKIARRLLSTLSNTKKKLNALGIPYDFFKPVDVPEILKDKLDMIVNNTDETSTKQVKDELKKFKLENIKKEIKTEQGNKMTSNQKIELKMPKQAQKDTKVNKNLQSKQGTIKIDSKNKRKEASVPQNEINGDTEQSFISIKETNDSDSSINFDSDEFEKIIDNDDDIFDDNRESEEEIEQVPISANGDNKKTFSRLDEVEFNSGVQKKLVKQQVQNLKSHAMKRGSTQSSSVALKKVKFEKKIKKSVKKNIKKRK